MLIRKVLSRINTASKLTGPIIDFSVAGDTASSTIFTNEQFVSQYVMSCIPSHPIHPKHCMYKVHVYVYI